jgi:hypothetical protein
MQRRHVLLYFLAYFRLGFGDAQESRKRLIRHKRRPADYHRGLFGLTPTGHVGGENDPPVLVEAGELLDLRHGQGMLDKGDLDAYAVWKRILRAVEELQGTVPGPGVRVH